MNARGQAVATWVDARGSRAANFDFAHGWSAARVLAKNRGDAIPWIADSGRAEALGHGWWMFQRPDGNLRNGGVLKNVEYLDTGNVYGTGSQMAMLFRRDRVTAHILKLP